MRTDYTVFNEDDLRMTPEQRLQAVCKAMAGLVESDKNLWTMVGEWSPAATDCALSLNGMSSLRCPALCLPPCASTDA